MISLGGPGIRQTLSYFLLSALGAGLMTAALIGLLLSDLFRQKEEIFEEARHSTEFRARLMGDHAARAFEAVDLILFSLASELAQNGIMPSVQQIHLKLHERMLFLSYAVTLSVYDAKGILVADAKRLEANENVSGQAFFHRHRNEGILFHLEGPLPRRFDSSGRTSLRLSRTISRHDGTFQGVLLAEIDPGFFRSFYREEDPLGDDQVTLLDETGRIMVAEQPERMPAGKLLSDVLTNEGIFLPARLPGGLQRLESAQTLAVLNQLPNFPLRIAVLVDKSRLLATWHRQARETGFIVAGLLLTYIAALALIGFLLQRRAKAETDLRLSEAHLRAIHDNSDIGIVRTDTLRRIIVCNPAFAKMLGTTPEELAGRDILEVTHPDDVAENQSKLKQLHEGSISRYALEKRYRRLDNGAVVRARVSAVSVKPDPSAPPFFFAMVDDITEARHAKETIEALLKRSQLLLSAVGEGILGLDAAGKVAFVNPAAEALLGYSAQEMIGKHSHALVHHHHIDGSLHNEAACPMHSVLSDGKPRQAARDAFWRKDHVMVPVEYIATPMLSETGIEGAVIAFRDVSKRLEAEDEIRRSNGELEQFAYAISHDLQEPLRMVASYVQLLGRRYQGKLDKDADDFIGFAVDGAKRMQQMITDLLDFSRIQRKGNPMAPVALDEPLQAAIKNLELSIEESKAKVTLDSPLPTVRVDAAQMARLFQNLIGNAVKYRDPARPPEIRIGVKRHDAFWQISITDNGIGIDPQYFERIFQIFQRLHARADYPGTGVGLAICRRIVERHGGKIWLESAPGFGSTFFFSLPAG